MNKFIFINILLFSLISNLFAYGENKDLEKDSKIDKEKMIVKDELGNITDLYFIDGMKYFLGEVGVSENTKLYLVKCPYKICKDEITENKITTLNKDYKSSIILFRKSVEEFKNVKAGEVALKFLKNQLNYKERRYSKYLVIQFEERIGKGYGYEEYLQDMIFFAEFLSENNNFLGNLVMGEIYYNGVLGKPINEIKAKYYFDNAINICNQKSSFECVKFKSEYKSKFK